MELDPIAAASQVLLDEHATPNEIEERTVRMVAPVKGDPALSVLRVLGLAQAADGVGAAAHGPGGVAAGVWKAPHLHLARWTAATRRVTGYRLPVGVNLSGYVRTEGRIPTHFETGNWYGAVPDEVADAFLEVGMLLDDPPFPVEFAPPPPAPPPPPRAAPKRRKSPTPRVTRAAAPKPELPPTSKLCPACDLWKPNNQFPDGASVCVDCD